MVNRELARFKLNCTSEFAASAEERVILWLRCEPLPAAVKTAIPLLETAGAVMATVTTCYVGQPVNDLGVNVARAAG